MEGVEGVEGGDIDFNSPADRCPNFRVAKNIRL